MTGAATAGAIRAAQSGDAPELARLLTMLGHATSPEQVMRLWEGWVAEGNSCLVAPVAEEEMAGLVTLHRMVVLHRPRPVGRITSLVVDPRHRGAGVGRALVSAAEDAFMRAGCGVIEVTSHERFRDAHSFYEHLGYARTSVRFGKTIS